MDMPLSGLRVLGATRLLAGPYVETLLADMGAEDLTIELPGVGDDNRNNFPQANGIIGTCFLASNRNKKSITLDLRTPEGQEIFRELVKISDIVVENNRPGTMAKWNIGYEQLKEINPGIIMASLSGYGQTGPYSQRTGVDIVGQAAGGLMSITGMKDGPPLRVGNALADYLGGLYATYGILSALYYREKTGKGQYIDTALVDSVVGVLENVVPNYNLLGMIQQRNGSRIGSTAPYNCFSAKDGYVVIGVTGDVLWNRLVQVMGREDLLDDPRFQTAPKRVENADLVDEVTQAWVSEKTVDEVVSLLAEVGVPCSRVNDAQTLLSDPQIMAREMLVDVEYPGVGKFKVPGITPKLSLTPGRIYSNPPTLGQHNDEVYRGLLNFSDEKMNALREKGII
ncbi:MAG: CaiB/BaiF CoA transferase family protein [Syntrophomonadaceae bacterium]|jgi:crotonobetainyl-CoA:carnitine CoA-transferase CaiB-like acyl-CoA transferase